MLSTGVQQFGKLDYRSLPAIGKEGMRVGLLLHFFSADLLIIVRNRKLGIFLIVCYCGTEY
jgi:hypothetical protein